MLSTTDFLAANAILWGPHATTAMRSLSVDCPTTSATIAGTSGRPLATARLLEDHDVVAPFFSMSKFADPDDELISEPTCDFTSSSCVSDL
jgi:hypothetical protein